MYPHVGNFCIHLCVFIFSFGGMDSVCCEGSAILELKGYETSTAWLWYSVLGLAGLLVLFMTLAYVSLRLVKKEK